MKALLASLVLLSAHMPVEAPRRASDGSEACLATLLYVEARGEPVRGQRAVLDVVVHRVLQSGLPVCEVIKAKGQFQWYKGEFMPMTPQLEALLRRASRQPRVLRNENFRWFFSTNIETPVWAKDMDCRQVGNHFFCKEKNDRRKMRHLRQDAEAQHQPSRNRTQDV